MAAPVDIKPANDRELVIARKLAASPQALFRCWTEPALIEQWFSQKPMTTVVKTIDLRPGGVQEIVIRDPKGNEYSGVGVYLEIVPNRKLVITDAFSAGWVPNETHTSTTEVTFEYLGDGQTLYVARARHPTAAVAQAHVDRGFYDGWGPCAEQLETVARTL